MSSFAFFALFFLNLKIYLALSMDIIKGNILHLTLTLLIPNSEYHSLKYKCFPALKIIFKGVESVA